MFRLSRLIPVVLCCLTLGLIGAGLKGPGPRPVSVPVPGLMPVDDPPDPKENPHARSTWEYRRLANPRTGLIPAGIFQREQVFARTLPRRGPDNRMPGLADKMPGWVNRGPHNIGGRTRALAIDVTDPTYRTLLAGGVTGGLWRTTDDGATWTQIVGTNQLHNINCIVQDTRPGHEHVWYYGTGEGQKTILEFGGRAHRGDGIFKSVDGGLTWQVLPATATYLPQELDNPFNYVMEIVVDTSNLAEDEVYAATHGIIYRSVNGGDTWTAVLGDENQLSHYTELLIDGQGVLYASLSSDGGVHGVFRSEDGLAWTDLGVPFTDTSYGRVGLGASPANPGLVFMLTANPTSSAIHELWRYTHAPGGGTWSDRSHLLNDLPNPYDPGAGWPYWPQRGYNLHVSPNPVYPNAVFIGGVHLWRSADGWTTPDRSVRVGGYYYDNRSHHADQHRLIWQPGSGTVAYTASDGGVHKTLRVNAAEVEWTSLNHGLNTTQFYSVAVDQEVPGNPVIAGGTQDNGTLWTKVTDPEADWVEIFGGDGAGCTVLDAAQGDYLVSYYFANTWHIRVDDNGTQVLTAAITPNTGDTFLFINPGLTDPQDEKVHYVATADGVLANRDFTQIPWGNESPTLNGWARLTSQPAGESISALGTNAQPGHALYYGTVEGRLFRLDAVLGAPVGSVPVELTGNAAFPVGSWINGIGVHPQDDRKVLVCSANYEVESLWYTDDGGLTWTDVEGNLAGADGPSVRSVAIVPLAHKDLWLAGTSVGLFSALPDSGEVPEWVQESPDNIGNVIVEALTTRPPDGLIVAGTYGRGIFSVKVSPATPAPLPGPQLHLAQNVPNPFNPSTRINFSLRAAGHTELNIYDMRGQRVRQLLNGPMPEGDNQVTWNGRDDSDRSCSSGIYLYRLINGGEQREAKMTLVR